MARFSILLLGLLAVIAAIGIGYGASVLPAAYLTLGIASLVSVFFLLRDRLYVLYALALCYIILLARAPSLADVGGFSLRVDDVLFAPLLIDSVMRLIRVPGPPTEKSSLARIMLPIGAFLAFVGMNLFVVARGYPQELGTALASFLRLLTASLFIIIGYTTFTTEERLERFVWILALLGILSVLIGAYELLFYRNMALGSRVLVFMNPNALGVVSGLLVVCGVVQLKRGSFDGRVSYLLLVMGGAGIALGKSIGATLATVVTVGLYLMLRARRDMLTLLRLALGIGVALSIFVALLFALRPNTAQALLALEGGSFVERLMLAHAGVEIFKQNPVWGVGWRMSSLPAVIGTTHIGTILRSLYRGADELIFPEGRAPSVHNMYIQFLAELGLVGTLLFVGLVLYIGFVIRAILRESTHSVRSRGHGEYFALGLVFLLVWWNTNPLYGGQLESFLCFIFLGGLAALPNISRRPASGE